MSRRKRTILAFGLALLGLLLLVCVSAFMLVRSGWFHEKVRERIVREIEDATGGRAELGSFSFDWRDLRADVRSFTLHGTEGPGEPPLFQADAVRVGLKITAILRRDVDVSLLALEEPRMHIAVYEDGCTNLPQPKIASRFSRNPVEQMLGLAVGKFSVENGVIDFNSRKIPLDLRGERLRAQFFYDAHGPRYTGEVSFQSLHLQRPFVLPVAFDTNASVAVASDRLEVSGGRISAGGSSLSVDGTVRNWQEPRAEFRFTADLALKELSKPLRLPFAPQGILRLTGEAHLAGASDYELTARVAGNRLAFAREDRNLRNVGVAGDLRLSPGRMELGDLRISALGGDFGGRAELEGMRRFNVEGELKNLALSELSRLAGNTAVVWNGRVAGPLAITGELARSRLQKVKANGRLAVVAETGDLPVQGSLTVDYDQSLAAVELKNCYFASPSSRIEFDGVLGRTLRISLESTDLNDFLPIVAAYSATPAPSLPVSLRNGQARFDGLVIGELENFRISGRASLANFLYQGRQFDSLTADITLRDSVADIRSLALAQRGMLLRGEAEATLQDWRLVDASSISGSFSVRDLRLEKAASEAGWRLPVSGTLTGSFALAGTAGEPALSGKLLVARPVVYDQQLDQASAELRYANGSLEILSARVEAGRAQIQGHGVVRRQAGDWGNGSIRFELSGNEISLSQVPALSKLSGVDGRIELEADGQVILESSRPRLTSLRGKMRVGEITLDGKPAGKLDWTAGTGEGKLLIRTEGEIAGAAISGESSWRLDADYPARGEFQFKRLALASLRPWWVPSAGGTRLPLEGYADGNITFTGQGLDPESWKARVELPLLEITPEPSALEAEAFSVINNGPIILDVDRKAMRIERAKLVGKETDLEASGTISFERENAVQVRLQGGINLAALHNLDRDLTASGNSTLDATIRGRLSQPEIYGRLEFRGASFYLSDVPNGIDKASGVILFSRDRATIEKITAETGGGELKLGGFIGFGGEQIVYRLQADAQQVRVRYPEGVSTTLDAALRLTGTSLNSTLSGNVTIIRSGVSPRVDLAGMLARSTKPMVAPATQNKLLRGMLFDIQVQTSPNARFDTALTRDVQAEADLRLRGTPYKPALLGRLSITQGEINFLGTRYEINRGDISFLNPVKLEPVLNLDLGTRVMGTEVSITFSGPPDRLNVTYRSDPPLQPNEIIALLAVGRAPSTDPAVTARQAELDQSSLGQIGATSLIGQALAAPVTGRLQRFFGVSRIRIDPRLTGVENNPQTQLTVEQQVSRNLTLTYITSVSRGQEQVIRVEWNINKQWSILGVRNENGLFGIDVLFRKQFK